MCIITPWATTKKKAYKETYSKHLREIITEAPPENVHVTQREAWEEEQKQKQQKEQAEKY